MSGSVYTRFFDGTHCRPGRLGHVRVRAREGGLSAARTHEGCGRGQMAYRRLGYVSGAQLAARASGLSAARTREGAWARDAHCRSSAGRVDYRTREGADEGKWPIGG